MQHLMTDQRSLNALDVAERHVNGQATDKELSAAWTAAKDAWADARVIAGDAAWAAVLAARNATGVVAGDAAWVVAQAVAGIAAWAVAQAVARIAAWAAWKTARDTGATAWVAEDAARETIQAAQAVKFKEMVSGR